jgi:hypothetical protein
MAARHLLALGMVACAASFAGPPPSPPSDAARAATPAVDPPTVDPPGVATPGVATPGAATPDDDFIEFLGRDDVGDSALWAFLKKSAQRKDSTSTPPPQDAKQ